MSTPQMLNVLGFVVLATLGWFAAAILFGSFRKRKATASPPATSTRPAVFVAEPFIYSNSKEVPKGDDVYYRCTRCGCSLFSRTSTNETCKCGNIVIDVDYFILAVRDFSKFEVARRVE